MCRKGNGVRRHHRLGDPLLPAGVRILPHIGERSFERTNDRGREYHTYRANVGSQIRGERELLSYLRTIGGTEGSGGLERRSLKHGNRSDHTILITLIGCPNHKASLSAPKRRS